MNIFIKQFLLVSGIILQTQLCLVQAASIEELVALVDKKRSALASGEVNYTISEGIISQEGADKLRKICQAASLDHKLDVKVVDNIIKSEGSEIVTRNNILLYSGDDFVLTEKVPSSAFDEKLLNLAGLKGAEVVFKMSAFNGLYSFLDPFRNQLQLNQTDLPDNYPADSVLSLDLTLANYKNLLIPVPDRTIALDSKGEALTVRFQRSANGYELQKYTIQDGIIYLTQLDAVMGKSGTRADKFFLNYTARSDSAATDIKSPSAIIDITQPQDGPIMFKYYQIENWVLRKILDTEFLIEAPPGVRLIK